MPKDFKRPITPKQKNVLDFIVSSMVKNGYAPSLKEIGTKFELATSTVHQHVEALRNKGYLKKESGQPRGVVSIKDSPDATEIPLLGIIAAGSPIEPIENPEPIKVPREMVTNSGDYYALRVRGDSMIDDGIWDRDIVVIKHQPTANDGDTIVAITENGATLKIFKQQNGKIYLEPRNKNLNNIYPKSLEIRGKFVGLIRKN